MTVRERKFWIQYYEAKIERARMQALTPSTTTNIVDAADQKPKFRGQAMM